MIRALRRRREARTLGFLAGALVSVAGCSAFDPDVGPFRDAGHATCAPVSGGSGGYGGYGGFDELAPLAGDAGPTCGDAS